MANGIGIAPAALGSVSVQVIGNKPFELTPIFRQTLYRALVIVSSIELRTNRKRAGMLALYYLFGVDRTIHALPR